MTHGKSVNKSRYFYCYKKERIHANKRYGSEKKNNVLRIQRKFTDPDAIQKYKTRGLRTGVSDLKEA